MGRKRHSSKQVDALLAAFLDERQRWRFGYELSKQLTIGSGSQQLGHANPAITLSVYAHEFARAEHAERVVDAVQRRLGHVLR